MTETKTLEIRTSDRNLFRECRRHWSLASPLRGNYTKADDQTENINLWFGTGVHYALEDYYGWREWRSPERALEAYTIATQATRPEDWEYHLELGKGMLGHYVSMEAHWGDMTTVWIDDQPACEVEFKVLIAKMEGVDILYAGTFDRIIEDPNGKRWIVDYKTARQFNVAKLPMDPQVSAYLWAYRHLFHDDPEGVLFCQIRKQIPEPPKVLKDGTLSCDRSQPTTADLFEAALREQGYGTSSGGFTGLLDKYVTYLDSLREERDQSGDRFVRRDLVRRNAHQIDAERWKIDFESSDMLDPDLPIYPNPGPNCSWKCDFVPVCVSMDDGGDWEHLLEHGYMHREDRNPWRERLPSPSDPLPSERGDS